MDIYVYTGPLGELLRGVVERYVTVAVTSNEEGETYINMNICLYVFIYMYI